MRRAIMIAAILLAAGVVGYWLLQQGAGKPGVAVEDLETTTVERGDIEAVVDATGSVEPEEQIQGLVDRGGSRHLRFRPDSTRSESIGSF